MTLRVLFQIYVISEIKVNPKCWFRFPPHYCHLCLSVMVRFRSAYIQTKQRVKLLHNTENSLADPLIGNVTVSLLKDGSLFLHCLT